MPGSNQHQPPDKHIVQRGHITSTNKGNGGVTSGKGKGRTTNKQVGKKPYSQLTPWEKEQSHR